VLTPAVGSHQALVGTAAHTVGRPLRHRVFVGRRPSAVGLEPEVRVAYGDLGIHDDSVASYAAHVDRLCFLVHPSSNRVYGAEAPRLAASELRALAALTGSAFTGISVDDLGGVPYVSFDVEQLDNDALAVVSNLSSVYAAFRRRDARDDAELTPLTLARLDRWDSDLITIQKYAGKTNEQFTKLLVNLAIAAAHGAASFTGDPLRVLDPLCGRGTTLNQIVMYGFDAVGVDIDRRDIDAYTTFFVQWLKDKRAKHQTTRDVDRRAGLSAPKFHVEFSHDKESQKAGVVQRVATVVADTEHAGDLFKRIDALATDLPYGVQHGSRRGETLSRAPHELLAVALPSWLRALRTGGGIAISYNANITKRADITALLNDAGAEVLLDDDTDFRHRVDRAIVRDVIVARKHSR
jgi:SAM-dependent methyltransferase